MKKILLALIPCCSMFATDHCLDLTTSLHNSTIQHRSYAEIDYRVIFDANNIKIFFNPIYNQELKNKYNFSYAIGFKKDVGSQGQMDIALYRDYSYTSGTHHFQLAPCLQYHHPLFDLSFNAYFPLTGTKRSAHHEFKAHRHYDATLLVKIDDLQLGANPSYDSKAEQWGFMGFIRYPLSCGWLKIAAGENAYDGHNVTLSFDFCIVSSSMQKTARDNRIWVKSKKRQLVVMPAIYPSMNNQILEENKNGELVPLEENHIHFKEKESWWRVFGLG